MFRPPEYAALINPAYNAFPLVVNLGEAVDLYFKRMMERAMLPESQTAFLLGLGPKDWSPIGVYKLKEPK